MNRLVLIILAAGVSVTCFALLHRHVETCRAVAAEAAGQLRTATNELTASQTAILSLQSEVNEKRARAREAAHSQLAPELVELLESRGHRGRDLAWAQLREQLGIGWDTSPDYVLVSKQAIKDAWYGKLKYAGTAPSDDSISLLSVSPDEAASLKAALARAREGQWSHIEKTPPAGDMVAEITLLPPDPAFEAAQSNAFTADITSVLGAERAGLFLSDAWREFRNNLAPTHAKTMIIRQATIDGQPDLICEVTEDGHRSTWPVRYAHYPNFPVMKLFPGGWQAMAKEMNFDLPPAFFPPDFHR